MTKNYIVGKGTLVCCECHSADMSRRQEGELMGSGSCEWYGSATDPQVRYTTVVVFFLSPSFPPLRAGPYGRRGTN